MTSSQTQVLQAATTRTTENLNYRADIDGLRAVAVLGVVIFHAFPSLLKGGFVGVDVFFVISGYLITGIVSESIQNDRFSIAEFYFRRINRIFPALLVVLISSLLFAFFVVLPTDFQLIGKHIAGGIGFVQNLILYSEAGYFDSASTLKPLLHLWSLGIEEQFYLVLPLLALILAKNSRAFLIALGFFAAASFASGIYYLSVNPTAAFYFPVTRAWELLVGAVLAVLPAKRLSLFWANSASLLGVGFVAGAMLLLNEGMKFPGWLALLPVIGSALIITAGTQAWINRYLLASRPFVAIGLISYPLYLWHWLLLSFSWLIDGTTRLERLALVVLAFFLAWATYRLIERPVRSYPRKGRAALILLAFAACLALAGAAVFKSDGFPGRSNLKDYVKLDQAARWEYGKNELCTQTFGKPEHIDSWMFCFANTTSPEIALIGNSFANHLYPGLANHNDLSGRGILSIGFCDPAAHVDTGITYDPSGPCAGRKSELERAYLDNLVKNTPSIKFVILNAWWPNFDEQGNTVKRDTDFRNTKANIFDHPERDHLSSFENYFYGLSDRISTFEQLGKTVIILNPKPELGRPIRDCIDRPLKRKAVNCVTGRAEEYAKQKKFREGVQALAVDHPRLRVFDQFDLFCNTENCQYFLGDQPLLRDDAHLSEFGSEYVMGEFVKWAKINVPGFAN